MTKTQTMSGVITLALLAGTAAAQIPWSNPNGMTNNYTFSNGRSANGFFGDPTFAPDGTMIFNPINFRAESVGGTPDQITDQLQVTINAKPNFNITGIRITEFGDYTIAGNGEVTVGGGLFLTNLNVFGVRTDTLVSTPGSPITTPTPGAIWSASVFIDLSDQVGLWNSITLQLDNTLTARTFDSTSTALIEKKVVGGGVLIEIVPAPGSVALLGLAGLAATRRRRG